MSRQILRPIVGVSLLILMAIAATGCKKKEVAPASAPTPAAVAQEPAGVSSIPTPAERASDMSAVELPLAGAVKEVRAKVLDKEAAEKTKGLLKIKVFDAAVEITQNTRFEVWKPGADPEEQKPESSAWASSERAVEQGTWDLRLSYEEGPLCKADGWIRGIGVVAGKMWKAEATLAAPMQYVRLATTLGGKDSTENTRVEVFKAGTDMEEFKPSGQFWASNKQPILAGSYDLRLSYDKDKVMAKKVVKGFTVGGDHGVKKETMPLDKS